MINIKLLVVLAILTVLADIFLAIWNYRKELYKWCAAYIIIGLLIKAELKRLGIQSTEKDQVYNLLTSLVDPDSQTKLTESGVNKLNEYASGGYDVLSEELPSKPYSVEEFLRTYRNLINPGE